MREFITKFYFQLYETASVGVKVKLKCIIITINKNISARFTFLFSNYYEGMVPKQDKRSS